MFDLQPWQTTAMSHLVLSGLVFHRGYSRGYSLNLVLQIAHPFFTLVLNFFLHIRYPGLK